ncbi:hypothetical protein OAR31_02575 [Candidatus Marinimicrobia bacterium]|nr:hypothetical protein [Candidatus Neomarinimicrobiota bacterium]
MSEYKRDLGLIESVAIVVSRIIGSGIFKTPAPIMALVGLVLTFSGTFYYLHKIKKSPLH